MMVARGFQMPFRPQPTLLESRVARVREEAEHAEKVFYHLDVHADYLEANATKSEEARDAFEDESAQQEASTARYFADKARDEANDQEEYRDYLWD